MKDIPPIASLSDPHSWKGRSAKFRPFQCRLSLGCQDLLIYEPNSQREKEAITHLFCLSIIKCSIERKRIQFPFFSLAIAQEHHYQEFFFS